MNAQIDPVNDSYSDKLVKLLPAEGTAALLAASNLIPNKNSTDVWLLVAIIIIGIFVYFWGKNMREITKIPQLVYIVIGYLIWAINITSYRFVAYYQDIFGNAWESFLPALAAILYSLFIPFVFPNEATAGNA